MCSIDAACFDQKSPSLSEPTSNMINLTNQTKNRFDALTTLLGKIEKNDKDIENLDPAYLCLEGFVDENQRKLMQKSLLQSQDEFKKLAALSHKIAEGGDDVVDEKEVRKILESLKKEKSTVDGIIANIVAKTNKNNTGGNNSKNSTSNNFQISTSSSSSANNMTQNLNNFSLPENFDLLAALTGKPQASTYVAPANGPSFSNQQLHGKRYQNHWEDPTTVAVCKDLARPKYDATTTAEEKLDTEKTLDKKLDLVAEIIENNKKNKSTVVYSGAGLSTAAGIGDYASKAKGSLAPHMKGNVAPKGNRLDLKPTLGHHALAAMESSGHIHFWVQQNHDRLAQKAGYPQEKMCEIHGAWGDHKNPVVAMSGSLRSDLYAWWEEWCDRADVCLVVGTSLAGMNADNLPKTVGRSSDNLIIIGLTPTGLDHLAGVRIWGLLDDVLEKLAKKLSIKKVPNPDTKRKGDIWITQHPGCKYNTPVRDNRAERLKEEELEKKKQAQLEKKSARGSVSARGGVFGSAKSNIAKSVPVPGSSFSSVPRDEDEVTCGKKSTAISGKVHRKTELSGSRLF